MNDVIILITPLDAKMSVVVVVVVVLEGGDTAGGSVVRVRSEEHTSELQSH